MKFRKYHRVYNSQWLFMRAFLVIWTIAIAIFLVIELAEALSDGLPIPWTTLGVGFAMLLAGLLLGWFSRRWFNFLAGEEICQWRYRP